jgi:hypothetical protein
VLASADAVREWDVIAAMHESGSGPSRQIAVRREFGRQRCIAEVEAGLSVAESDARDPERTSFL